MPKKPRISLNSGGGIEKRHIKKFTDLVKNLMILVRFDAG